MGRPIEDERTQPFVEELMGIVARERGCEPDDLSLRDVEELANIVRIAMLAGKQLAYMESTAKMSIPPRGQTLPFGVGEAPPDDDGGRGSGAYLIGRRRGRGS